MAKVGHGSCRSPQLEHSFPTAWVETQGIHYTK